MQQLSLFVQDERSPSNNSVTKVDLTCKAISLWQPWASLIPLGLKHYETRSWKTNYRGKLLICSTVNNPKHYQEYLKIKDEELELPDWDETNFPHGRAIAICDLVDCIEMTAEFIAQQSRTEILCGDWQIGRYAWKLENIQAIAEPFAVKGKQGLFSIPLKELSALDSSKLPESAEWSPDDWETPNYIAHAMVKLLLPTDEAILEPCAGTGQIAKHIPKDRHLQCFELNKQRVLTLMDVIHWSDIDEADFLAHQSHQDGRKYDVIITNPPFSLAMEFVERSLQLLRPDYEHARLLFLMPLDIFCSRDRGQRFEEMNAHIHHVYKIDRRIDYLKNGIPASQCQKFKHGMPLFDAKGNPVKMSGRQCYDAVFDIRPGRENAAMSRLKF